MRPTKLWSLLVAVVLVAAGCGGGGDDAAPTDGTTTTTAKSKVPVALRLAGGDEGFPSPFGYRRGPGYVHASFIYDTLLWKDGSGKVLPWLAESFKASDDGLTYAFELRKGVKWHDGKPFTAKDVEFTFTYFGQQKISPQVIVQPVPEIEKVVAVDDLTVEFTLSAPAATFLQFGGAGAVPIVPEHIWSTVDRAEQASDVKLLVGTGPYRLESYSPGEGSYLYTSNEDYFLGPPVVNRLEFVATGDPLTALRSGELSMATGSGLRPDALSPFQDGNTHKVLEAPPGSTGMGLYWNLAKGGALADPKFRRANALALDAEDMVKRFFGGNGTPGNPGWIPPKHPFHVDVEQYDFDLDKAKQILDEAGYANGGDGVRSGPDGKPLTFELLVAAPAGPPVEFVVGALAKIGVKLNVQALDTPAFNQRLIAGDSEMSMIGFGGMNSDLAPDYLRLIYSSKTKLTQHAQGYMNPKVDELAEEQLHTLDTDERKKIVAEIQRIVADDLPLLPLFYPTLFAIHDRKVFDAWYFTPGGVAGVVPTTLNKHVLITGEKAGLPDKA